MIISKNKNEAENVRRNAIQAADTLNKMLETYNLIGLPLITTTAELKKFGEAPFKYWGEQVDKMAEKKGMAGADTEVFAALFNLEFKPAVKPNQAPRKEVLEYVRIHNGQAAVVGDLDKRLAGMGTVEVTDPKEEQVARDLMRTFRDFSYWSTILAGGSTELIKAGGTQAIGFSPMAIGQLSMDTVKRAAEAMSHMSKKEFTALLVKQSGNKIWSEIE